MRANRKNFVIMAVSLLLAGPALAQCENGDFESNAFDNWVGYTGYCCPPVTNDVGIVPGRHTLLTNKNATDPRTFDQVKLVCPQGGNVSVQLGNSNVFQEAERLRYKFMVSPDNALFTFRYAVVLDDAGHDAENQPRFEINMFDQFGDPVPCGNIKYVASANLPGFFPGSSASNDSSQVIYRNWSTELVDLRGYLGQTMTIDFMTNDCGYGGHFGYAYIDGVCETMELKADGFCTGDSTVTLTAREGFYDYLWSTGDTTQIIQYNNPKDNDSVWVRITPTGGASCSVTLGVRLKGISADPGFIAEEVCLGDTVFFTDTSLARNSVITSWSWDFGNGNTSVQQHPKQYYTDPGIYAVSLAVSTAEGCKDSVVKEIRVHAPLAPPAVQCDSVSYDYIRFKWATVKDADGYRISLDNGLIWSGINPDTSYQVLNLNPGDSVTLMVSATGSICGDTYSPAITCRALDCPDWDLTAGYDTTILQGDTAQVSATANGAGIYKYSWNPSLGNGPGPFAVSPVSTTVYYVTVTDSTAPGCPARLDSIRVAVECRPFSVVLSSDTVVWPGESTSLTAMVTGGIGPFDYFWTPDIGSGPGPHTIAPATTSSYSVTVEDQGAGSGCPSETDEQMIRVLDSECNYQFRAPDAFSPNGDQLNDEFRIQTACIAAYELTVYNRWGERFFTSTSPDDSWKGYRQDDRSQVAPDGVYVYIVKIKTQHNKIQTYYGTVTVLR